MSKANQNLEAAIYCGACGNRMMRGHPWNGSDAVVWLCDTTECSHVKQPFITPDDFQAIQNREGLTVIQDSTGAQFAAYNRGVNDEGTGLLIDMIGRLTEKIPMPSTANAKHGRKQSAPEAKEM